MSPIKKPVASSDVYTAIVAIAFGAVIATAAYVAFTCYTNYGTIFSIVEATR